MAATTAHGSRTSGSGRWSGGRKTRRNGLRTKSLPTEYSMAGCILKSAVAWTRRLIICALPSFGIFAAAARSVASRGPTPTPTPSFWRSTAARSFLMACRRRSAGPLSIRRRRFSPTPSGTCSSARSPCMPPSSSKRSPCATASATLPTAASVAQTRWLSIMNLGITRARTSGDAARSGPSCPDCGPWRRTARSITPRTIRSAGSSAPR